MLSNWDCKSDFLDPMCGSGTILTEAAMIACNIPPNLNRDEFSFENWPDFDVDLFELIENAALKKIRESNYSIQGFDMAPSAISKCDQNIINAGFEDLISISKEDFFRSVKVNNEYLHLVFNPPYGERLSIDLESFYKKIGDTLKTNYSNSHAWFITSSLEALKYVGLRPSRKIKLFNGKLESRLAKYEIYSGSKKLH